MLTFRSQRSLGCMLVFAVPLFFASSVVLATPQEPSATTESLIKTPKRRAPDAPPAPPPNLPAQASSIVPQTLVVAARRGQTPGATVRQTVSRTAERVHMLNDDGREWLFERNPIDQRRASATLVDHKAKTIVLYEETDLRMTLGLRGWLDVITLGAEAPRVSCAADAQSRVIGSVRFSRCQANLSGASFWWSENALLAAQFRVDDARGGSTLSIERIDSGVDAQRLTPAVIRFPTYRVLDFADSLEGH